METKGFVYIDNLPVPIQGEANLLEMIRKANIKLPTFCYNSELSIFGACRMCMVEMENGSLESACSTVPKDGMRIRTSTDRLRRYRKNILELLLANHCRDCTTCSNNGSCKLQDLAVRYDVRTVRFDNKSPEPIVDNSSYCIVRDQSKCIRCGDCVRVCNEVQDVGAIDFMHRGASLTISTAFEDPIFDSPCVGCGQCAAVCPTGAIVVRNDAERVWKALDDRDAYVTVQVAPAVRVAIGKEYGLEDGKDVMGLIVSALRRLGFDKVYDTSTGADFTIVEEGNELRERIEKGGYDMPMFSSCCPAWVRYCEKKMPEILPYLSTCRSPMQMLASMVKATDKPEGKRHVHVAVMPCTAKKFEAARELFSVEGTPNVDYVISTQELILMIEEMGLVLTELDPQGVDSPFGSHTGAGVIFGASGGVTEAVLRYLSQERSVLDVTHIAYSGVRGMRGVKVATAVVNGRNVRIAVVSGLGNARALVERCRQGEKFDFVEVMSCPGGCVSGAGQPFGRWDNKKNRAEGLYAADRMCAHKYADQNNVVRDMYTNGILKDHAHDLLHVDYLSGYKKEKPYNER